MYKTTSHPSNFFALLQSSNFCNYFLVFSEFSEQQEKNSSCFAVFCELSLAHSFLVKANKNSFLPPFKVTERVYSESISYSCSLLYTILENFNELNVPEGHIVQSMQISLLTLTSRMWSPVINN